MLAARAGRQHRYVGEHLRRWINVVIPLVLAMVLIFPAVQFKGKGKLKGAQTRLVGALRTISVQQSWRMYAPNPSRSHTMPYVVGVDAHGEEYPLEESIRSDQETGRVWLWKRRRIDFWRFQVAAFRPTKPNRNRSWYLRGVCVRESRKDNPPRLVHLYGERVNLTPPKAVRNGKPVLGKPRRAKIETASCVIGRVPRMIEEDGRGFTK